MSENNLIQYNLTVNTEMAYSDVKKLETLIVRATDQLARLTDNKDIDDFSKKLTQTITLIRQAQIEARILQRILVLVAAGEILTTGGLITVAQAGVGAVGLGLTAYDFMNSMGE